jgi:chromosome partitioning protein
VIDMAGKLISVANMKGGVGKTTTVVSLAEALSADDPEASILVVDLDPQASASVSLAGDNLLAKMIMDGRTVEAFLEDRLINNDGSCLAPKVHPTVSQTTHCGTQLDISFLPCGPDLRMIERQIIYELSEKNHSMKAIEGQIWKLFKQEFLPLAKKYDYVIFDCPPGISPVSEAAIRESNLVIVPTIADFLSVYGLKAFLKILWKGPKSALPQPRLPHVLITRWQANIRQFREVLEQLEDASRLEDAEIGLFKTKLQQSAELARALKPEGTPTFKQKYGSVTTTLDELVTEVKGMLNGKH